MSTQTIISPSLLSADFVNLEKDIRILNGVEDMWFHLDIMDGHFVPNLTFGGPVIKRISEVASSPLDAHIMVSNPRFHIELMKDTPLHNLTFHVEATQDEEETLELIKLAKKYFPSVGISLRPKTPLEKVSMDTWRAIDLLLVMSVEPGFGGQSFIETTWERLEKINTLKKEHALNFSVQIDGGVGEANASKLIASGVTNLVAGSFVFKEGRENIVNQINKLR